MKIICIILNVCGFKHKRLFLTEKIPINLVIVAWFGFKDKGGIVE